MKYTIQKTITEVTTAVLDADTPKEAYRASIDIMYAEPRDPRVIDIDRGWMMTVVLEGDINDDNFDTDAEPVLEVDN